MTSAGHGCTSWAGDGPCGAPARLYPAGWRCDEHAPGTARPDRRTRMLQAALNAAARGWHVFPLRPGTKRPARPDHDEQHCDGTDPRCCDGHTGGEHRATPDPARIRRGWADEPYNIGIACGPSRLVVVDLDTPKPGDTPPPEWHTP